MSFNADKGYFPLREGMQTFSMDGRWVSRKPLGAGFEAGFSAGFILVPMFAASVYFADHGVHLDVFPIDKDTTEIVCQWYVHEDAVEGEDYEVDRLIGVFDVTNREDVALAELTQRGVRSRRFVPGPNSSNPGELRQGSALAVPGNDGTTSRLIRLRVLAATAIRTAGASCVPIRPLKRRNPRLNRGSVVPLRGFEWCPWPDGTWDLTLQSQRLRRPRPLLTA